jgi:hypothetical protein
MGWPAWHAMLELHQAHVHGPVLQDFDAHNILHFLDMWAGSPGLLVVVRPYIARNMRNE